MIWRIIVYPVLILLIILIKYPPIALQDFVGSAISNSEKDNRKFCFQYIDKYKYALHNKIPNYLQPNGRYQDCVWTLWLQGEKNTPTLVKNCIQSFKTYLKGRRIIVVDENTLGKYIKLPPNVMQKYKSGKISKTYFSDIVRYCLLYKYGGLWIDATVLLTDRFPSRILAQDFFMFSTNTYFDSCKLLTVSWLIYAPQPGNIICKDIINLNFEYWKHEDKLMLYLLVYAFFTLSIENDTQARAVFEKMITVYEQFHFARSYIMPYSDDLLNSLIKHSHFPIHKLSFKGDKCARIGVIDKNLYENSILYFFTQEHAFETLQKKGLAKNEKIL